MKAMTAASYGVPTGEIAAGIDIKLAIATQGKRINLPGGLPVIVDGHVIGGIGVAPAPASRTGRWRTRRSPRSPARGGSGSDRA
jgi:uncharacterized protein GlcG (DUF336 family)